MRRPPVDRIFGSLLLCLFVNVRAQTSVKLLIVTESTDVSIKGVLDEALAYAEKEYGDGHLTIDATIVEVDRNDVDSSFQNACAALMGGVTMILDVTWTGWENLRKVAFANSIIYRRTESTIIPYVRALTDLLSKKNATDVALIFENERDLNRSLYYLIGNSIIRLVVIDELSDASVAKIRAMRPSPSYYAIFASTENMERLFKTALEGGLVARNGIMDLIFIDNNYQKFKYISGGGNLNVSLEILTMSKDFCCRIIGETPCNCPADFQIFPHYIKRLFGLLVSTLIDVIKSGINLEVKSFKCENNNSSANSTSPVIKAFNSSLAAKIMESNVFEYEHKNWILSYRSVIEIETLKDHALEKIGNWTKSAEIMVMPGQKISPAKRYFRVGTTEAIPWSSIKRDPVTGKPMKDAEGRDIWEGYCIDFIDKLAEDLNFDYDLVIPADLSFGDKLPSGKWTGLVGDLARGETDIVLAALTMTSEREEVIDFVAPYFAQSGILIGSIPIKYKQN